jgi:GT2 family glycosyltransferase/2-polyprenyl-3-methyl-5-hydroxy-6-metoxy-1,4-benzoquinol methylase
VAPDHRSTDLVVVIPTRDRWTILDETLRSLESQTVQGFEIVVVVDGEDQSIPDLGEGVRVVQVRHGGPGAARNAGVRVTERPLVLFLGDDMVPTPQLVERHLDAHRRHPEPASAVLGHVEWHAAVPDDALHRWMDWSCTQFDYPNIAGDDAGWGRFYSCNVSLSRSLFLEAGGFDEGFTFDYEDLDLAWRLHQRGLQLWYERSAVVHHLHPYDWDRLVRRYESRARGERLMQLRHDWFEPYFTAIVEDAARQRRVAGVWPKVVERVPGRLGGLQRVARQRANRWYHQQVAPQFLAEWEGQVDLDDLRTYLGDEFDLSLLHAHVAAVDAEEEAAPDEETFYRTSRMYLYDLTAFAMTGTKRPYLADLRRFLPRGSSILDYGCGVGTDGLRLIDAGYRVSFADFANPSTEYLRWRLERRGLDAPVLDLDRDEIPGGFDAAMSLDVIEHVDDPFAFLRELEARASIVMVNLLEPDPDDTHLHRPLPIGALLDHAASLGILRYRRYHGRSHLVIYRTQRPGLRGQLRNLAQRRLGPRLPGSI